MYRCKKIRNSRIVFLLLANDCMNFRKKKSKEGARGHIIGSSNQSVFPEDNKSDCPIILLWQDQEVIRTNQSSSTGHHSVLTNQNFSTDHISVSTNQSSSTDHLSVSANQSSSMDHLSVLTNQSSSTDHLSVSANQNPSY